MNIDGFIPATSQQAAVLLESNQYEVYVLHFLVNGMYVIGLRQLETGNVTHAISYKQRSVEGRVPEVKLFKSFPIKELVKFDFVKIGFEVVK